MNEHNKKVYESRKLLKDALIDLLESKELKDISVTELCKLSGVSRSTYYRHNESFEEILIHYLREWFFESLKHIIITGGGDQINYHLFTAWQKEIKLFKAIVKCKLDYAIITEQIACIQTLLSDEYRDILDHMERIKAFHEHSSPYTVYALAGHSYATMLYWINHPELSPTEITQFFDDYVNSGRF